MLNKLAKAFGTYQRSKRGHRTPTTNRPVRRHSARRSSSGSLMKLARKALR